MRRLRFLLAALLLIALALPAAAFHFYRGPGSGCTPADGPLGAAATANGAAVLMGHTTFHDIETATPVTVIAAGESVTWYWWSSHCHSARANDLTWTSGFHYPAAAPESPPVAPNLLHYPVPDGTPTLSFTRLFSTPGTYAYSCEHHAIVGMVGVVVVT